MARQTLGRGLSALLGEEKPSAGEQPSQEIDIDLITPNPEQPRTKFSEGALEELAQSIRVNGIVQPIVVRPYQGRFQIVAGERRWRAAQRAELRRIPAVVKEVTDEKLLELALVENIQRQELNPIEEAKAYRKLIDTIGLTQESVAEQVGKERSIVTTALRLLRLPNEIQKLIEDGRLSAGHGRALLMIEDQGRQKEVADLAIAGSWSVRELERTVRADKRGGGPKLARPRTVDANVKAAETKLMRHLNTGVKIFANRKGVGGKIEIEYYSMDDLDRIFQALMNK